MTTTITKTHKVAANKKVAPALTKHILATFFAANAIETVEGNEWYPTAYKYCEAIANDTGLSVAKVAAVCAALSPNNKWEKNVADTEALCVAYVTLNKDAAQLVKVSTYNTNKQKALDILEADDNEETHLVILNGQKVKAFYLSIMGNPDAVCVDGHAYYIWVGKHVATTKTPSIGVAMHKRIVASYVRAKDSINKSLGTTYTAAQIQAITWVTHKRIHA